MFKDRIEAGKKLADKLKVELASRKMLANVLVALPRGGMPVAAEIAGVIAAPITVLVSKKIPAPMQAEFAVGAVSSTGVVVINHDCGFPLSLLRPHIEAERKRLTDLTKSAELKFLNYAGLSKQLDFTGKRAIIVDDGIATGMTVMAAADSLAQLGAAEVIIATPVISREARKLLAAHCQAIVAVLEPSDLCAIGMYYEDFHQVPDEEVCELLTKCSHRQ